MFKSKKSKPLSWLDAALDALPKPEPKHRVRKGMIGVGVVAAGSAALAALLNKRGES